jgi:hypothetical protein
MLPTDLSGSTQKRHMVPLQRVYQFLEVYSVYRDRVPQQAYGADTPMELADAIHDTLYGEQYTAFWYKNRVPAGIRELLESTGAIAGGAGISPALSYIPLDSQTVWFYIREFTTSAAYDTLRHLARAGYTNIILDVRGNGGGEIAPADSIVELFLPAATPYQYRVEREYDTIGDTGVTIAETLYTDVTGQGWEEARVAVLVNDSTASSAEILATGIRDGRNDSSAVMIGEKTYGKGIGQKLFQFPNGDVIQITAFRFSRVNVPDPASARYHRTGIVPDSVVYGPSAQLSYAYYHLTGDTLSDAVQKRIGARIAMHAAPHRVAAGYAILDSTQTP